MTAPSTLSPAVGRTTRAMAAGRDAGWLLLGNAAAAATQWAVIVMLARLGGPDVVGRYAIGLAVSAPLILLAGLALRTVQVTDARSRYRFGDYLRLRLAGAAVALCGIAAVAMVFDAGTAAVVILVGAAKALDAVGDIFCGLFQRHGRMRDIAVSMTVNGAATLVAMTALLYLTGSAVWAVVGSVAASALASLGYCVPASRRLRTGAAPDGGPATRLSTMVGLAGVALPLGLAGTVTSVAANLPRYVVEDQLGMTALGIFAALGYVALGVNLVCGAAAQAILPRLTRMYADGQIERLRVLSHRLVLLCVLLAVLAVPATALVGRPLLRLLYGAEYAEYAGILVVLLPAVALASAAYFLDAALSAARCFGNQLAAAVTVTAAALAAALLIPAYGLAGAAWAVAIPAFVQCGLKTALLRRVLRKRAATAPATPWPASDGGSGP
ncbi:oligosaccharide flippase family protein [Phytohabitans sp. ZYX-F-186]|uniref:Oligosaccharide flippase family protein n=1 Tax=Phytohabitans maris TaxID=3071409 RepID=A0ABU0ZMG1_9ACTN|nr:oligosaccharide flippase family protein [Phytohabitans sp. ZYX-F-186]MDQ7908220.1 oligosaccharide flippase family protein [Phytohabitans sp. ZYX-F-186]